MNVWKALKYYKYQHFFYSPRNKDLRDLLSGVRPPNGKREQKLLNTIKAEDEPKSFNDKPFYTPPDKSNR